MDDIRVSEPAPASQPLATVVRYFAGSRVERQLLAQVFDMVWQVPGSSPRTAANGNHSSSEQLDDRWMPNFSTEGVTS